MCCSVAVELKELQPCSFSRNHMDDLQSSAREAEPLAPLDAGHISFAAIPRPDPTPVVVAPAERCSPHLLEGVPSATSQPSHSPERGIPAVNATAAASASAGVSPRDKSPGTAAAAGVAQPSSGAAGGDGSSEGAAAAAESQGSGSLKGGGQQKQWAGSDRGLPRAGSARAHSSSASLDSIGDPKAKSDRDGKR